MKKEHFEPWVLTSIFEVIQVPLKKFTMNCTIGLFIFFLFSSFSILEKFWVYSESTKFWKVEVTLFSVYDNLFISIS